MRNSFLIALAATAIVGCAPEYGIEGDVGAPALAGLEDGEGTPDSHEASNFDPKDVRPDIVEDPTRNLDEPGNKLNWRAFIESDEDYRDGSGDGSYGGGNGGNGGTGGYGDDDEPGRDGEPGSGEDLCRTQGYWRNHASQWPVETIIIGNDELSVDEAIALIDLSSDGDASLILVQQLIAAELNVMIGGPTWIEDAIDDGQAWMAANDDGDGVPYGISPSSMLGDEAVAISAELDAYNNQTCW